MNNNVYQIVKSIIEAEDLEESKNILFDEEKGIVNKKEFLVTLLKKRIEDIIRKDNNYYMFDINKHTDDIWNLIFLGELFEENIKIYMNNPTLNKKNLSKLQSIKELYNQPIFYEKVQLENAQSISSDLLNSDSLKMLKKGLIIIKKIRNKLSHNDDLSFSEIIKIDTDDLYMEIPLDFLKSFVEKIIYSKEDYKEIVKRTNQKTSILLKELGYSNKEISSKIDSNTIDSSNKKEITYNSSIIKTILGTDNPKMIALLVYMNAVFSKYDKKSSFVDIMNHYEKEQIIDRFVTFDHNVSEEFFNYIVNHNLEIDNVDERQLALMPEKGKKQLMENKLKRLLEYEEKNDFIAKDVINHIRNSISHFRFNMLENNSDQILLYDLHPDGSTSFELTIDIKKLFETVRYVELWMDARKNLESDITNNKEIMERLIEIELMLNDNDNNSKDISSVTKQ